MTNENALFPARVVEPMQNLRVWSEEPPLGLVREVDGYFGAAFGVFDEVVGVFLVTVCDG
jgi:hypothetical protein